MLWLIAHLFHSWITSILGPSYLDNFVILLICSIIGFYVPTLHFERYSLSFKKKFYHRNSQCSSFVNENINQLTYLTFVLLLYLPWMLFLHLHHLLAPYILESFPTYFISGEKRLICSFYVFSSCSSNSFLSCFIMFLYITLESLCYSLGPFHQPFYF